MMNRGYAGASYPVSRLRDEVDRVFDDVFGDYFSLRPRYAGRVRGRGAGFPAVNVWEDDANLYAEFEVPGLRMEDLEILVEGNELRLSGERRGSEEQEGVTVHRRERGSGNFSGAVQLPVEVDVESVEAHLESGVLTITLPKSTRARARKIEVKARG